MEVTMKRIVLFIFIFFIFVKTEQTSHGANCSDSINHKQLINGSSNLKPLIKVPWQKINPKLTPYTLGGCVVGNVASMFLLTLIINKLSYIAHELGHAIAIKFLFNISSTIYIPLTLYPALHACFPYEAIPDKGIYSAITSAAGPLCGLVTHLVILKINSIVHELITDTKLSIKKRIPQGLKKSLFDYYQQLGVQLGAFYGIIAQMAQFIPAKSTLPQCLSNDYNKGIAYTDGYQILKALGFEQYNF